MHQAITQPKISIITINFNNDTGLKNTIDSVISQKYHDYEYIIIDGGSSDNSTNILKQYSDKLKFWCSEPNNGIYNAMNKGIDHASGDYILFLNSGDSLYDDEALLHVAPSLGNHDIVYGDLMLCETDQERPQLYPDIVTIAYMRQGSLPHPASFIRRQLFDNEKYDESFRIVADWVFFCKKVIYENCSTLHVPAIISRFLMDGISNNKEKHNIERERADKLLFPPLIAEMADTLSLYESRNLIPVFNELAKTRKLHKRIMPFIRTALFIDKVLKRNKKRH